MNPELNFGLILKTLKKYFVYIVIISVISTGISAIFTFTVKPVYAVSATFYSINNATDYDYSSSSLIEAQKDLVNDYIEIIKSAKMQTVVRDVLRNKGNESASVKGIRSKISAAQIEETSAFTVTVSGTDTGEITAIIHAICNNVGDVVDETQQRKHSIDVLSDPDEIAPQRVSPNVPMNLLAGFAVGFFGSLILFFAVAFYDRTVRTEQDLKNHFEIPVIGVIPKWEN